MTNAIPIPASADINIEVLTASLRWEGDSVTFGVPLTAAEYGDNAYSYEDGDGNTVFADETLGFQAPAASFIAAVRDAAAMIESYTLLDMVELTTNPGDAVIRAGVTLTPKPTVEYPRAYAVGPKTEDDPLYHTGGDTWFPISGLEQLGNRDYFTVLHEMAHTIGLLDVNRPQDDGSIAAGMDPQFRSLEFTTQSYASFIGDTVPGSDFTNNSAPQSYMMWDIATMQYIYGADFGTQAGNTTYSFNPLTGEMSINGVGQGAPSANVIFRTIWDGNGTDTYDFSLYTTDLDIDLAPGGWSDVDRDSNLQAANLGGGPFGVGGGFARGQVFNAMLYQGDARSVIENAVGGAGDDSLRGNGWANLLEGGDGADTIFGYGGDDTLNQGDGGGAMSGGNGADLLIAGAGADVIVGNAGIDLVSYAGSTAGVVVNLGTGTGALGWAQGDTYHTVERVGGSDHGDILTGDGGDNILYGEGGNDLLFGAGGVDLLNGGDGDDTLTGGSAGDWLIGGAGTDAARFGSAVTLNLTTGVHGGEAAGDSFSSIERFEGSYADDVMTGSAGADRFDGRGGDDHLLGAGGNDTLTGGAGFDTLDGGSGTDTADYAAAGAAVQVNLTAGIAIGVTIDGDVLMGIERVEGSAFNDVLRGDAAANRLAGNNGNDNLIGEGGIDTLLGGNGNDTLVGGAGDSVNGGAGADVLRLSGAPVIVNMATGLHAGGAAGMSITGMERIEGTADDDILVAGATGLTLDGRDGDDSLHGGTQRDTLLGGEGADSLEGLAGSDILRGGQGADTVVGGSGRDIFVWRSGDLGVDLLSDFNLAEDRFGFGSGFLSSPVFGGTGALSEMLDAQAGIGGTTLMVAHTVEAGWQTIARLSGVSVRDLDAAIDAGTILAKPPIGGWDAIG
ncbi:MAG: M10 family metallopeptidase C-terminal domain-containing protein [Acetobacteraceae bacterium]|nr:M10 family metallopeptidase C-terminal domain-containing protein [Acetobacteraceae bacterium]